MGAAGLGSRSIIGQFFAKLSELTGQSWLDLISMYFESDQESETYKWLGQVPAMREWLGGRNAKAFTTNGITIINKVFEATLQVLLDEIRRDKTDQVQIRIAELAQRALSHWNRLLSTLITNGTGATSGYCYDGQYFFDIDHSEGDSGTQLNLLAAAQVPALGVVAPAAPTALESAKAILGVIGYMMGYKDNEGEPMNENAQKFLVMTSPALWQHLAGGVHSQYVGSGESNPVAEYRGEGRIQCQHSGQCQTGLYDTICGVQDGCTGQDLYPAGRSAVKNVVACRRKRRGIQESKTSIQCRGHTQCRIWILAIRSARDAELIKT